jgi:hypothetical protein
VLAVALALQACSAVKLGYNNLQTIAYWWIDGYVDFTLDQSRRMRDDLAELQQWHRSTELPRYAELLDRLAAQAAGEVSADQVCAAADEVRQRLQAVARQAEPMMTALSLDLGPDQVQVLEKKYAKLNAEYRRDWLDATPAKRADKRFEQVVDRSEMVYGRLEPAQREVVRQYLARSSFDPRLSSAEQMRRQRDVLDTLARMRAEKPSPAEARQQVAAILSRGFNSPDPAYRAYQQALQREGCEGIAAVHNAATPEQRQNAVRRLKGYAQDARDLAAARNK